MKIATYCNNEVAIHWKRRTRNKILKEEKTELRTSTLNIKIILNFKHITKLEKSHNTNIIIILTHSFAENKITYYTENRN